MPSLSAYTYSLGLNVTPENVTGISLEPTFFFSVFRGIEPSAFIPMFIFSSSAMSRTHPWIITPLQLFLSAVAATLSPSRALLIDPPPSTTKTLKKSVSWKIGRSRFMKAWHAICKFCYKNMWQNHAKCSDWYIFAFLYHTISEADTFWSRYKISDSRSH